MTLILTDIRIRKCCLKVIVAMAVVLPWQLFAEKVFHYSDPGACLNITDQAPYLIDPEMTYELEQVRQLPASAFARDKGMLKLGFIEGQLWVRFFLENDTEEPLFFLLENQLIQFIDCTVIDETGSAKTYQEGTNRPLQIRYVKGPSVVFPLGNRPREVILRIQSNGGDVGTSLWLSAAGPLIQREVNYYLFIGASLGITVILCFFAFAGFLVTKEPLFGWYALLQIGYMLIMGRPVFFALTDGTILPTLIRYVEPASFILLIFILFSIRFLNLSKQAPVAYRIMILLFTLLLYTWVIHLVASILSDAGWQESLISGIRKMKPTPAYSNLTRVLTLLFLYIVAWRVMVRGYKVARYYILGFSILILSLCVSLLALNGILPKSPFMYALALGFPTDSVFFAFALADRVNILRKEREQAQADLLLQARETQRHQQRLFGLRDEIARDLHDEMGSSLSSISMLSEALQRGLPENSPDKLALIGERARRIMDTMSDLVWSVNPKNDPLEQTFIRMREYATEMLELQGVSVHFDFPEEASAVTLPMNKRKELYLIFKEAINNCAKYADAENVWIGMTLQEDMLELSIRDDGRGFDLHTPNTGLGGNGLHNMRVRAGALAGALQVTTAIGQGVEILLRFPVP